MLEYIQNLKKNLQDQQEKLASEIRATESNLLVLKEGYIKVQGALEVLVLLEKESNDSQKEDISSAVALQ